MQIITPELLPEALRACHAADVPALVHGSPGIGKSAIIKEFAAGLNAELYDVRLPLLDPVDFGVPYTYDDGNTRKAGFAVTNSLFPTGPAKDPDAPAPIVFLDEITAAPSAMQVAAYSLVLDRRVREVELTPGTYVVGAGNLVTDGAVAKRLSTALGSRFAHFQLEADHKSWETWAMGAGIPVEVLAFLRFKPGLFYSYDRDSITQDQTFPCPRTWECVANLIAAKPAPAVALNVYASVVGHAAAVELNGFLSIWKSLPNADAVLAAPDTHPVPDKPAVRYALAGALAAKANGANAERFHKFTTRMGGEFEVLASRSAIAHNSALLSAGKPGSGYVQTMAYIDFCTRYADL